ncbi:MAG: hypothetical protein ACUVXF_04100 [Desulfobaccales bacterium]
MESTGEHRQALPATEPEVMKSLTLGIVGDLGRLLKNYGLGQTPLKILEAIIFAMFVVTETFVSVKKGLEPAREALDLFHEDMVEHIFQEYLFKHQKAQDMEELKASFEQLSGLINRRYQEYRQNFLEDYQGKPLSFRRTFLALASHLLPTPLPQDEKQDQLIAAFSGKLIHFWSGCRSSFQPAD